MAAIISYDWKSRLIWYNDPRDALEIRGVNAEELQRLIPQKRTRTPQRKPGETEEQFHQSDRYLK